jgi:hypothetical protein
MGLPKNVAYRFVDDLLSDQVEVDRLGERTFQKGDLVERSGKMWQVGSMLWELSDEDSKRVPTLWLYLTKARVN